MVTKPQNYQIVFSTLQNVQIHQKVEIENFAIFSSYECRGVGVAYTRGLGWVVGLRPNCPLLEHGPVKEVPSVGGSF